MADTVQPETIEEPKQAGPSDKPKQAEASNGSKPQQSNAKPAQPEAGDKKDTLKKASKIVIYVVLAAAALILVKWKFFTPLTVPVAEVKRQDFTGEAQGTGTINVDVLATVGAKGQHGTRHGDPGRDS